MDIADGVRFDHHSCARGCDQPCLWVARRGGANASGASPDENPTAVMRVVRGASGLAPASTREGEPIYNK